MKKSAKLQRKREEIFGYLGMALICLRGLAKELGMEAEFHAEMCRQMRLRRSKSGRARAA